MEGTTEQDDDDLIRVRLAPALPCGMPGCCNLTTTGLINRDPQMPGLWQLLPICGGCMQATLDGETSPPQQATSAAQQHTDNMRVCHW